MAERPVCLQGQLTGSMRDRVLQRTTGSIAAPGDDGRTDQRAMDRLFGAYMLVAAGALAFPGRPALWPVLLIVHLLLAFLALGVGPARRLTSAISAAVPRLAVLVHDWYPLLLMPLLYTELATLNVAVWRGRYFDPLILASERTLFGTQPSFALSRTYPYLVLSEPLHAAYLSYYFIIYVPPILLYLLRRAGDFRRLVFGLMLTFFVHYLFFIFFPVQGPRYLFPAPGGRLAEGPVYRLAHHLLEAGSSRGAAFPSSHVGVSTAQTILVFRYLPRLGPVIALLAAGLALGAIYGGFHYATDAIAGFCLGLLLVSLAPTVRRWLAGSGVPS